MMYAYCTECVEVLKNTTTSSHMHHLTKFIHPLLLKKRFNIQCSGKYACDGNGGCSWSMYYHVYSGTGGKIGSIWQLGINHKFFIYKSRHPLK